MSYPSTGFEGLYRNAFEAVKNRSEKGYGIDAFSPAPAETYGFEDHQAPSFQLLVSFCEDAKAWLTEDADNVVVVHCKAGKGRTGTVIAALLLYLHEARHAKEAIDLYGMRRTKDGKGVTIPSQIRYVHYFERWL
ncbi:protein-tyrosine phosphatase-like protein, partial [Dichotomocladium elegans]